MKNSSQSESQAGSASSPPARPPPPIRSILSSSCDSSTSSPTQQTSAHRYQPRASPPKTPSSTAKIATSAASSTPPSTTITPIRSILQSAPVISGTTMASQNSSSSVSPLPKTAAEKLGTKVPSSHSPVSSSLSLTSSTSVATSTTTSTNITAANVQTSNNPVTSLPSPSSLSKDQPEATRSSPSILNDVASKKPIREPSISHNDGGIVEEDENDDTNDGNDSSKTTHKERSISIAAPLSSQRFTSPPTTRPSAEAPVLPSHRFAGATDRGSAMRRRRQTIFVSDRSALTKTAQQRLENMPHQHAFDLRDPNSPWQVPSQSLLIY